MYKSRNKNWVKARKYFGIENERYLIMHHKDASLKYTDLKRYNEWRIEDLEVVTLEEHNRIHKLTDKMYDKLEKHKVRCVETNVVYNSICEASEQTNITRQNISRSTRNGKKAGGYHWKLVHVI